MGLKKRIVTFRVTEEEYELLKNRTEQSGIRSGNISEYVRRQVLAGWKILWVNDYRIHQNLAVVF